MMSLVVFAERAVRPVDNARMEVHQCPCHKLHKSWLKACTDDQWRHPCGLIAHDATLLEQNHRIKGYKVSNSRVTPGD